MAMENANIDVKNLNSKINYLQQQLELKINELESVKTKSGLQESNKNTIAELNNRMSSLNTEITKLSLENEKLKANQKPDNFDFTVNIIKPPGKGKESKEKKEVKETKENKGSKTDLLLGMVDEREIDLVLICAEVERLHAILEEIDNDHVMEMNALREEATEMLNDYKGKIMQLEAEKVQRLGGSSQKSASKESE